MWKTIKLIIIESVIIVAVSAGAALAYNAINPAGIPLIATYEYEIYTDCPEFLAKADYIKISKAVTLVSKEKVLFIDARTPEEFATLHIKGARNIVFDVLYDFDTTQLATLKKDDYIIVYDDTPSDDEFRQAGALASEIKNAGFTQVKFLYEPFTVWKEKNLWTQQGKH